MRRIVLTLLAATSLSMYAAQSVSAADLGIKAPPPAPLLPTWTGFYLGAHVGAGWGTVESDANLGSAISALIGAPIGLNIPVASHSVNGFLGGVQGGYNWQTGIMVLGIEGDFTWSGMDGNAPCIVIFNCHAKTDWMADITGRLGVVVDKALIYIKGGVAWADNSYSLGNVITTPGGSFALNGSAGDTQTGGLLGIGVEYAFMPNWSAKIEYNYIDFGKTTLNFPIAITPAPGVAIPAVPATINQQINLVKAGVNYRF